MVSRSRGWAQHAEVEADERWQQFRLKRIRDFIQEHIGAARRFTDGNSKRLTPRQYDNLSLLIYTSADGKREYIIPEEVFREQACGRMPWSWVLHTLENNGFLNGSPLIARNLVQPFGRVSMVILKPKILKFRTEAEQRADQERRRSLSSRRSRRLAKPTITPPPRLPVVGAVRKGRPVHAPRAVRADNHLEYRHLTRLLRCPLSYILRRPTLLSFRPRAAPLILARQEQVQP